MQQLKPLGLGLLAAGLMILCAGGTAFILMLVIGLEAFFADVQGPPTEAGILGAAVALVLKLVVPILLVWLGIRLIAQSNRRRRPTC